MSRHRKVCYDTNKEEGKKSLSRNFIALLRQSSKKNVKPHCRDKLATKAEDLRPEKFQFLERGQNRNFGYEIVLSVKKSKIYSLDLG